MSCTRLADILADNKGAPESEKRPDVDFGCMLGNWFLKVSKKAVEQKLSKILVHLYFMGAFFFPLFFFRLIEPMRIFFENFLGDFWTNYHVIFPYIDAFNTYIVTRAWNTKTCTCGSNFILPIRNCQKSISQPNTHPNRKFFPIPVPPWLDRDTHIGTHCWRCRRRQIQTHVKSCIL